MVPQATLKNICLTQGSILQTARCSVPVPEVQELLRRHCVDSVSTYGQNSGGSGTTWAELNASVMVCEHQLLACLSYELRALVPGPMRLPFQQNCRSESVLGLTACARSRRGLASALLNHHGM